MLVLVTLYCVKLFEIEEGKPFLFHNSNAPLLILVLVLWGLRPCGDFNAWAPLLLNIQDASLDKLDDLWIAFGLIWCMTWHFQIRFNPFQNVAWKLCKVTLVSEKSLWAFFTGLKKLWQDWVYCIVKLLLPIHQPIVVHDDLNQWQQSFRIPAPFLLSAIVLLQK